MTDATRTMLLGSIAAWLPPLLDPVVEVQPVRAMAAAATRAAHTLAFRFLIMSLLSLRRRGRPAMAARGLRHRIETSAWADGEGTAVVRSSSAGRRVRGPTVRGPPTCPGTGPAERAGWPPNWRMAAGAPGTQPCCRAERPAPRRLAAAQRN